MFSAALEAFNRATFDPPTPEIEIVPAETLQADAPDEHPVITLRFGLGLLALTAMLAGAHLAWVYAGMPGPSEIITAIMETLS